MLRLFAWLYAVVVAVVVSYAWVLDLALRNNPREHLLGDVLLAQVTLPLSLSLGFVFPMAPHFFGEFVQLTYLTILGALQSAFLFWLSGWLDKTLARAPNNRWRGP